jgi:hypothetical protein
MAVGNSGAQSVVGSMTIERAMFNRLFGFFVTHGGVKK